jgi:hypothetical protein
VRLEHGDHHHLARSTEVYQLAVPAEEEIALVGKELAAEKEAFDSELALGEVDGPSNGPNSCAMAYSEATEYVGFDEIVKG